MHESKCPMPCEYADHCEGETERELMQRERESREDKDRADISQNSCVQGQGISTDKVVQAEKVFPLELTNIQVIPLLDKRSGTNTSLQEFEESNSCPFCLRASKKWKEWHPTEQAPESLVHSYSNTHLHLKFQHLLVISPWRPFSCLFWRHSSLQPSTIHFRMKDVPSGTQALSPVQRPPCRSVTDIFKERERDDQIE